MRRPSQCIHRLLKLRKVAEVLVKAQLQIFKKDLQDMYEEKGMEVRLPLRLKDTEAADVV